MTVIPFAFIKYGDRIRANSKFCQELQRRKESAEIDAEVRVKPDRSHTPAEDRLDSKEEV